MSINAITPNTVGIQGGFISQNSHSKPEEKSTEEKTQAQAQRTQVSAEDVFKFMGTNATKFQPIQPKVINVSNYVDKESANRIAHSMADFEKQFNVNISSIKNEFNGEISNSLAEKVALSMI